MTAHGLRFPFVQLDVPGRLGLDDGRYLLREAGDERQTVVVVQTLGAAPARGPRIQRRARRAEQGLPSEVPLTRLTVIPAEPSEPDEAARELERVARDSEAAEATVTAALRSANTVVRAHRVASQDPYGHEIGRDAALTVRTGYGTGDGLAEGRWEKAVEVRAGIRRQRRAQALRPQERVAAVLAGRERIDVCEPLLLRARADLDQGRDREAALQLRAGLEALLAEPPKSTGPDQEEDLAALEASRDATVAAAEQALRGGLAPERTAELGETLRICERVLRRRQALRD
ncbi:MAG: hypothetical protein ACRDMH_03075 [Solirubrobacterales bacterium]